MKKTKEVVSVLALLALSATSTAGAALTNGSFELGTDPGPLFLHVPAGNTDITDWTVGLKGVDCISGTWKAADGVRSIDLNLFDAGSLYQEVSTVVGNSYIVQFALSGSPAGGGGVRTVNVSATGDLGQDYSFDTIAMGNTLTDMKWQTKSYSFTATTALTLLKFESMTTGHGFGPALDQVSLAPAVPVPGAILLCGLGTALVGAVRRRRAL